MAVTESPTKETIKAAAEVTIENQEEREAIVDKTISNNGMII